jgi:phosphoribosylanthranilate isomerase
MLQEAAKMAIILGKGVCSFPKSGWNRQYGMDNMVSRCLVQIYEVQTPDEAETLIEIGVDHIGSVLLSGDDWRQPSIKAVVDCTRGTTVKASLIPLFQNADQICRALDYYHPDIVHFCEALGANDDKNGAWELSFRVQQGIKERFPEIKMMRAIPIAPPGKNSAVPSLTLARRFEEISDYFLTDTLIVGANSSLDDQQPVSGFVGITGLPCDWDVAAALVQQSAIPVILAGGINPENVADGIVRVRPAGIDSCTCTNAVDEYGRPIRFRKDMGKVRQLVNTVQMMDKSLGEVG